LTTAAEASQKLMQNTLKQAFKNWNPLDAQSQEKFILK